MAQEKPALSRTVQIGLLQDGAQVRVELDEPTVEQYMRMMEDGVEFDPVQACFDGKKYWLYDGYHRVMAARRLKRKEIEVRFISGTHEDAQWLAIIANAKHGKNLTTADKRNAVMIALRHPKGAGKSDRELAKVCGVDHKTVSRWRAELIPTGEIPQSDESHSPTITRQGDEEKPSDESGTTGTFFQSNKRQGSDGRTYNTSKIRAANQARATSKPQPTPAVTEYHDDARREEETPSVIVDPPARTIPEPPRKLDSLNRQIHPKAQPVFDALVPLFKDIRQILIGARTKWNAFMADPMIPPTVKGYKELLSVKSLMEGDLPSMIKALDYYAPYTTCVYCKCQQECTSCNNTGTITKSIFESAPSNIRPEGSPPYVPLPLH